MISLQKQDSLLVFDYNWELERFLQCLAGGIWIRIHLNPLELLWGITHSFASNFNSDGTHAIIHFMFKVACPVCIVHWLEHWISANNFNSMTAMSYMQKWSAIFLSTMSRMKPSWQYKMRMEQRLVLRSYLLISRSISVRTQSSLDHISYNVNIEYCMFIAIFIDSPLFRSTRRWKDPAGKRIGAFD